MFDYQEMITEEKDYIKSFSNDFVLSRICIKRIYSNPLHDQLRSHINPRAKYRAFDSDTRPDLTRNEYLLLKNYMYLQHPQKVGVRSFSQLYFLSYFEDYRKFIKSISSLKEKKYLIAFSNWEAQKKKTTLRQIYSFKSKRCLAKYILLKPNGKTYFPERDGIIDI